jgi:hypothetical protein
VKGRLQQLFRNSSANLAPVFETSVALPSLKYFRWGLFPYPRLSPFACRCAECAASLLAQPDFMWGTVPIMAALASNLDPAVIGFIILP